jgi:hypothetical protein
MRILASGIIFALLGSQSMAQDAPICGRGIKEYTAGRAYWNCALNKAKSFERSGEPSGDVATAAIEACAPMRKPIELAVSECGGNSTLSGGMIEAVDAKLRPKIIEYVVEVRSKRGAPR